MSTERPNSAVASGQPLTSASEQSTREFARRLRVHVLRMTHRARASHVGTCLSIADVLAVLYGAVARVDPTNPDWHGRDRVIMSKGHGAAALYAALVVRGFFPEEWLDRYCQDGALPGHVTHRGVPGVDASTGSLGHGLSLGCGMALAAQSERLDRRTFVILSDGELDEGSIWEALMFAAHHRLGRLFAVIDYNKIQSFGRVEEVLALEPLAAKLRAFGWNVVEVDGHDHAALSRALTQLPQAAPTVLIAHTVKGKGVSFMEDRLEWHYRSPSDEQLAAGLLELGAVV